MRERQAINSVICSLKHNEFFFYQNNYKEEYIYLVLEFKKILLKWQKNTYRAINSNERKISIRISIFMANYIHDVVVVVHASSIRYIDF